MNLIMKKHSIIALVLLATFALSGCVAQVQEVQACLGGEVAGFWLGIWHGFIAPFAFVVSLFSDSVTVFEVNNNGSWYLFGFLLGIGAFTGGGTTGAHRARRRRS